MTPDQIADTRDEGQTASARAVLEVHDLCQVAYVAESVEASTTLHSRRLSAPSACGDPPSWCSTATA